jgi:hypothetical protein
LRLRQRGASVALLLPWIAISAAGLLTHYFFAFVWGALCLWLLLHPHRARRVRVIVAGAFTGLLVLPWYLLLPASLDAWRVTGGWLNARPEGFYAPAAHAKLLLSYVAASGSWGAAAGRPDRFILLLLGIVTLLGLWRGRGRVARPGWQMLWMSLAAVMSGLALFDLFQGTYARHHTRYALPGIAAAYLLLALVLAQLPALVRTLALVVLVALWVPGLHRIYASEARHHQPFPAIARIIDTKRGPGDLVLVASSPSGVLGVARYVDPAAVMTTWVSALRGRRVPEDIDAMTAGRHRVFLVQVHGGRDAALERYLRSRTRLVAETHFGPERVVEFVNDRAVLPASAPPLGSLR